MSQAAKWIPPFPSLSLFLPEHVLWDWLVVMRVYQFCSQIVFRTMPVIFQPWVSIYYCKLLSKGSMQSIIKSLNWTTQEEVLHRAVSSQASVLFPFSTFTSQNQLKTYSALALFWDWSSYKLQVRTAIYGAQSLIVFLWHGKEDSDLLTCNMSHLLRCWSIIYVNFLTVTKTAFSVFWVRYSLSDFLYSQTKQKVLSSFDYFIYIPWEILTFRIISFQLKTKNPDLDVSQNELPQIGKCQHIPW